MKSNIDTSVLCCYFDLDGHNGRLFKRCTLPRLPLSGNA